MIKSQLTLHATFSFCVCLVNLGLFLPLAVSGQNQPPRITSPLANQLMDQAGDPVSIDLTNFIIDPDVSSPAVQLDVKISGSAKQIYLAFFSQSTPLTVANFIRYIEAGRFDDNIRGCPS